MRVAQQNVPAFYIDNADAEAAYGYVEKNAPLLKGHLLVFSQEPDETLKKRCEAWELCFCTQRCGFKKRGKQIAPSMEPAPNAPETPTPALKQVMRTVRSGEVIEHAGDLLIAGNINDGALVSCQGSLSHFGVIEGNVECHGAYMIASFCRRGRVRFLEHELNAYLKDESLKLFTVESGVLVVKELK